MALWLLLWPAAASADDAARARRLFSEGKAHYGSRSYAEALHSFQAALKLVRRSSVIIMVARSYRNLDRPDRALAHYRLYGEAWRREHPSAASPHGAEARNQISRLQTILDLVQRAEALQPGQPAAALALFQTAVGMSPWPRIHAGMARCHLLLRQPHKAQSPLKAALGYWERYRVNWTSRHPNADPPDHAEVQRRVAALRQLEQEVQLAVRRGREDPPRPAPGPARGGPVSGPPPSPPGESPGETPRPSTVWLALGIGAAALAVTAETLAWVGYSKAGDYHEDQPEYDTYRNLTIAGHVVAGTMAAASAVSFYLYFRGGKSAGARGAASVMLLPGPHGWAVMGRVDF